MDLQEFGLYFAELREKSGFSSQRQLAQKSGISNGTIARIESGVQKATPETLISLARHLEGNPYLDFLSKLGYVTVSDISSHNELLKIEKYKSLFSSLYIAYQFLKSEGVAKDFIDEMNSAVSKEAKKHNIEFDIAAFEKDPEKTITEILRQTKMEYLDLINVTSINEIRGYKDIDKIISENVDFDKRLDLLKEERQKLNEEIEKDFLDNYRKVFYDSSFSTEENGLVNDLIRKAVISKRTGKPLSTIGLGLYEKNREKKLEPANEGAEFFDGDIAKKIEFFEHLENDLKLDLTDPEVQKKLKRAAKIIFSEED
ncbi:helix-turn-helix domain-containing protein [Paenibacillus sp. 276b]|uniref:helix-turn-helix domain-containing protein n=1 Tax=Paenibacillus sp. 276b TaxID=1566277 RepID=UPI00089711FA|nr:helix-turn-helix transcriptional regulator [Paenibacillus sp. 276b]SEB28066.1 Helix-turn-helix [Paenibacillus sp. 276b]